VAQPEFGATNGPAISQNDVTRKAISKDNTNGVDEALVERQRRIGHLAECDQHRSSDFSFPVPVLRASRLW